MRETQDLLAEYQDAIAECAADGPTDEEWERIKEIYARVNALLPVQTSHGSEKGRVK